MIRNYQIKLFACSDWSNLHGSRSGCACTAIDECVHARRSLGTFTELPLRLGLYGRGSGHSQFSFFWLTVGLLSDTTQYATFVKIRNIFITIYLVNYIYIKQFGNISTSSLVRESQFHDYQCF